ncbi:NADP oxidoreductase [Salinibacter sp. 10B]|uniref:Rossmann-like and DUF2520 domain-containing protein n=1 Tax=Salinibacter sp. 10B TaxID=1923971 RepID=UPI000CF38A9F|nr:DUF2520 domain-containing protein [Salinibacter sp. 10B]PQJ34969.1 NADP oxidoreductase [Salinibacter sp. 10B]
MPDEISPTRTSPVAIVGAGAVGTALARRLVTQGHPVQAVLSRTADSAQALAERVEAPVDSDDVSALPSDVRLVLLCVPDDAIASVAERLATVDHPWADTIVGHTSGAHTAEILSPLADRGAATLSFHPLQTFAPTTPPEAFENILVGVEGKASAVAAGTALAKTIGARPVELTAESKALYHCAAALASNGLVALMAVVEEVFAAADVDAPAVDLVAPLVHQTWQNLKEDSPERSLTGPVARGDRATVESHLDALSDAAPHLVPLYAALSTEMTRTAVRGGHLDSATAEEVLQMLQKPLQSSSNSPDSTGALH